VGGAQPERGAFEMKDLWTYGFAGVMLAIVAILVVPLPPVLLDVLLAVNLFASACVPDPLTFFRARRDAPLPKGRGKIFALWRIELERMRLCCRRAVFGQ